MARDKEKNSLGFCFLAILAWIFLEYGRPANPLMLPMTISTLLFFKWLLLPEKKWNPQIVCFFLLLGEMLLSTFFAKNSFAAFWATYGMIIILVFICIPLIHVVDSLRKVSILLNIYLLVLLYVGVYAIFHSGFGPAGSGGGQDENYVAAFMCMALPVASFMTYFVKSGFRKLLIVFALGVYTLAIVIGFSRGGFVGMVVIYLYYLLKSPKKGVALSIGTLAVIVVLFVASDRYWQEMNTITDTKESTADLRLEAWAIAFRMFQGNPLLGVGPNNFIWNISAYQSPEQYEKFDRGLFLFTHSMFFQLLSELGVVGVGLFVAVLYYNFRDLRYVIKALQEWRENLGNESGDTSNEDVELSEDDNRICCYANGLMGSLIGLMATFTFLSGFYFSNFWILTAMTVALKEVAVARLEGYEKLEIIPARQESFGRAASLYCAR